MRVVLVIALAATFGSGSGASGDARAASGDAARIELRAEAESAGPFVLLSDVAKLKGVKSWGTEELGRLPLGLAPTGSARTLTREYVACRLRQGGFDAWWLGGAEEVTVKRGLAGWGRVGTVKEAVGKHMAGLYGLRAEDVVVEMGGLFGSGDVVGWDSEAEISVLEPSSASSDFPGKLTVIAEARPPEGKVVRISVPVTISVWKDVMVARKNIPRRRMIMAGDVEVKRVLVGEGEMRSANSLSDLVGKRVLRAIGEGSVIMLDAVEELPLIKRGDVVTAEVQGKFFTIRTYAKARESGKRGEMIEVENPGSRQVFLATVIDKNTVEVSH